MKSDSEDFKASCVPVMSCADAKIFEKNFFSSQGEITEEIAMRHAGTGIGAGVIRACGNAVSRVLVLVGKGHNGGDAILAAVKIFSQTACRIDLVLFVDYEGSLSELTRKACEDLCALVPAEKRKIWLFEKESEGLSREFSACIRACDVVLDGVFGHGFRPPFPQKMRACLTAIYAELSARGNAVRCAVDLPSGLCDSGAENCFAPADISFATGIVKTPLLAFPQVAGRIVPVKVGFPVCEKNANTLAVADEEWAEAGIFAPRPAFCDKRAFGHALIVGGSRAMPGALMLNVLAALRAGTGLVSVICPESVHAAFAARAPGAMWIPCRENSAGGLDCSAAMGHFRELLPRVSAVLCGSGMGTSKNTQTLIEKIAAGVPAEIPLVLDADALRAPVLAALRSRGALAEKTILLPHSGEFFRMGGSSSADALRDFCREHNATLVLKGSATRIADAGREVVAAPGSPVLARGGSGDVLAGIVVGLFASEKNFCGNISAVERATAAVIWHGNAARRLASACGERCADIALLPEYLSPLAGQFHPPLNNPSS